MPSRIEDDRKSIFDIAEESQRSLRERPSFSIRARLTIGFALWLILSLGITVISIITIAKIKNKLYFTEAAGNYTIEIQQARRFEKNYFLYRTNLDDALEHVHNARVILDRDSENMSSVIGKKDYQVMVSHLERYEELLTQLKTLGKESDGERDQRYHEIEKELRLHGAEMVTVAEELLAKERKAVNSMLVVSQRIPLAFLFVLILLIAYLTFFIATQMLAPLARMMQAARRIADGDLTPITAHRKYRDEFSDLAMAMNHMISQLVLRHDMLVKAHKLKAVGTLTAGVAHELNNPINNIMLTAAMLQEDYAELPDEERLDMIDDMVGQSERARKIVRNLLDFARESDIDSQMLEVGDLIGETLQLASNQIKLAKAKVETRAAENLPAIFGDRQQLTQVFLNMVLNALDAMPGGGALAISAHNTKDRDFVSIEFADTGAGIPEQNLNSIFDPFFSTKTAAKGTGLGLSVSLGIVKQHGGDIQVSSRLNKGTTFTIMLPVAKVPANIGETLNETN